MSETPKGPSKSNGEQSPEKRDNPVVKVAQRLGEVAVYTWGVITGRGSGKRTKDTSGTIAPEYPVYPKPSFPEFVTTPDGNRSPVESGNTPAALIEPPEPTPDELAEIKRKDEARAAAAKRSTIDRTNPEGLTPYEQAMRDKYLGDEYDEAEYGDDEPEKIDLKTHEAATNLKIARSRFAKASVAVESHFFKKFFGGKKRQDELEAAAEQLKQSELEYMRIKFADEIEAAKQDADKQAELAAEIAQAAFANMQETSKRTSERYDEMLDGRNKFKKYAAKVGEWFTKGGKVSQWLKLGGAGFAVGTTTVAFAGWPITTATFVATKLAVAGALKQNILEERRGEDRIAKGRPDYLDSSFAKDMAGKEADYVMNRAVDMSVDELKDVSVKRQEDLYRRIGSGLVKYTIGFGLGGLAGNWLSSTYATGDSVPQSGIEDSVPQSGNGAVDTGVPTPEAPNVPEINFDSYDYPWDWAAEKFGDANAMDQLHNLADKAMANGHTVEWFNNPDGSVWMKVDGSSATADVLKVLNKYA